MNILFVVPYVPSRVRVRPYQLVRALAARGHRVNLLTIWTTEQERSELNELRDMCATVEGAHLPTWRSWMNCLAALPTRVPLQAAYSWHAGLACQATRLAEAAEVVHVEHLRGSPYALSLQAHLRQTRRTVPVLWDSVDCISLLFAQAAQQTGRLARTALNAVELGRTRQFEGRLVRTLDRTLTTSDQDAQALRSLATDAEAAEKVRVLPNGVDLEYFRPGDDRQRHAAALVMTGKMSYHANVAMVIHFVREVLPLVRRQVPGVSLWVVGKDPPIEVRTLGSVPGVTVTGTVPDVRPYLRQAGLALAPLAYGVGIQNKVLEAMACGAPVVATPQAVAALQVVDGREVVLANDPPGLAGAIVRLIADEGRRRELGAAGRRYVEAHHDWSDVSRRLEEVYHELIRTS